MAASVPARWDLEVDFVSVGSGIGGLAAAITAHDHGLRSAILEKSDKVGGVTAYSYGEVWVPGNHLQRTLGLSDSPEAGYRYLKWLSMGYADDRLTRAYCANAPAALKFFEQRAGVRWRLVRDMPDYYWQEHDDAVAEGRVMSVEPFPGPSLGEWQEKTRLSPHVLYGMTHEDMFGQGGAANFLNWDFSVMGERLEKDERCLGPGLAAYFVKGALDRKITFQTGTPAQQLVSDGDRVIGIRAEQGGRTFFVKAERGVLIATGGYDWNPHFVKLYEQRLDGASAVPPAVTGDHLALAGDVGAKLARVPAPAILGYHVPGEGHEGQALWRFGLVELGLPHTIVVNRTGRRFADESFWRSVGFAVQVIDGASQTHPNYPCWAILDSRARERYPYGPFLPGQGLPETFALSAPTIRALGAAAGIDPAGLEEEIAKVNGYARSGKDLDFHRGEKAWSRHMCGDPANAPNPTLGTVERPPFYAVRQTIVGSSISSVGLAADAHGRVLNYGDRPIAGLYVAGNSMALLDVGAGHPSGIPNGRGMTFAYLAARHAAGDPSGDSLEVPPDITAQAGS